MFVLLRRLYLVCVTEVARGTWNHKQQLTATTTVLIKKNSRRDYYLSVEKGLDAM